MCELQPWHIHIHSNNKVYKLNKHIKKAIKIAGSQEKLAKSIGVKQAFISFMLNGIKPVPATLCLKIERATEGKVKAIDLRPDVFSLEIS